MFIFCGLHQQGIDDVTRFIGSDLTADLIERFSPDRLPKHARNAILLVTVGEDGYPHPAMLSHFEIVAKDARNLRLATYTDSRTTNNMRRTGYLSMVLVDRGLAYYLKGTVKELRAEMVTAPHNALLNFQIESVNADHANVEREGETRIEGGITIDYPNMRAKIADAADTYAEMLA